GDLLPSLGQPVGCGACTNGGTVIDQLLNGAVTGNATGRIDAFFGAAGQKACCPWFVVRFVAGHIEQRGRSSPTNRGDQQIGIYPLAGGQFNGLELSATASPDHGVTSAGINDRGDIHAGTSQ